MLAGDFMADLPAPDADPPLILIVDDDPSAIHQLHAVTRDLGEVRFCLNGEDALRMVRETRPDLVLLDLSLPGISGEDTCRALRRHLEPGELPIIFVTAHGDPEREMRALALGANDFISKPFNPPVARARVETHLALKRRSDALLRLTHTDPLTSLANRRRFDLMLEREWRRALRNALPICLLMIDVDHFKAYNDAHGHLEGDACLRQIGAALREVTQRPGDLAARYGGEEFAILLPHTELAQGLRCAEKVHAALARRAIPQVLPEGPGQVTLSIGLCALEAGQPDSAPAQAASGALPQPGVLVETADQALYLAKQRGRNQTQFLALGDRGG